MAKAERCVCCGEIIPEGQQTCPNCEKSIYARHEKAMRDLVIAELERMLNHENEVRRKKDG